MLSRVDLEAYLNDLLTPQLFKDYCPNGLQIEGKAQINILVTGVSANQALLNEAIKLNADAILVHHGFFWKNEYPCVVGIKHQRIAKLIKSDISLFSYHLPLDGHGLFGNNIQLGKVLDFNFSYFIEAEKGLPIIAVGELPTPLAGQQLQEHVQHRLQRQPLYIPGRSSLIRTIAWCTGAAQDFIELAIASGVDAYLTGEVSERTVSIATESGIHFFAAGHHATERYGVNALGEHLAEKFGITHVNVDIPNPV